MQTTKKERNTHMSELLDKILSRNNMLEAYKQVKSNKGSAGIDGVTMSRWMTIFTKIGEKPSNSSKRGAINLNRFSGLKSQNQTEEFVT
ncbi:hypothetical protein SAG0021_02740 [Streptococcus agalactiae FSL S3-277]|nr:hypothetical protein SAG0021_02740 [Streptococcus agalactiae FSL S3-277]